VAVVEESILDRDQHLFVTYTRNIGYTSTMNVIEKCIFAPSPLVDEALMSTNNSNPKSKSTSSSTLVKREAWINSQMRGFGSVLQRFGVERYKHNANNATKGLTFALNRLYPPHSSKKSETVPSKLTTAAAHAVTDLVVHKIEEATAKAASSASSSTM